MNDILIKPISELLLCNIINKWIDEPVATSDFRQDAEPHPVSDDDVFSLEEARRITNGNESVAYEMLKMLIKELPEHLSALNDALDSGDFDLLRHHTHKLNGASRCCGTVALKNAADRLESTINDGDTELITARSTHLLYEINRLLDFQPPYLDS